MHESAHEGQIIEEGEDMGKCRWLDMMFDCESKLGIKVDYAKDLVDDMQEWRRFAGMCQLF